MDGLSTYYDPEVDLTGGNDAAKTPAIRVDFGRKDRSEGS